MDSHEIAARTLGKSIEIGATIIAGGSRDAARIQAEATTNIARAIDKLSQAVQYHTEAVRALQQTILGKQFR
jgi:hypothetical protein